MWKILSPMVFSCLFLVGEVIGAQEKVEIRLKGPLLKFEEPILVGIENTHPNGFTSPMEAWDALRLYARGGNSNFVTAVLHKRGVGPWTILPLIKIRNKNDNKLVPIENLLEISNKTEVRFTFVHVATSLSYAHPEAAMLREDMQIERIPALIAPPSLEEILNQMLALIMEDYKSSEQELEQLKMAYFVTPAGLFTVSIDRAGWLYEKFKKKKYPNQEVALLALRNFPLEIKGFTIKVQYLVKQLNFVYSEDALELMRKGKNTLIKKEFFEKKKLLADYLELLKKHGVNIKFIPFLDQIKFWEEW